MKSLHYALLMAAYLASSISANTAIAQEQEAQQALDNTTLQIGTHTIKAEVARSKEARQRGLMYRLKLADNSGMLFIFDQKSAHCFWMRNTLIPLSIAFLDDNGTIINIEDMQPQTDANHCAQAPTRYALEVSQGWFTKKGVQAGDKVSGLPE